jgi:hypothetical protein
VAEEALALVEDEATPVGWTQVPSPDALEKVYGLLVLRVFDAPLHRTIKSPAVTAVVTLQV